MPAKNFHNDWTWFKVRKRQRQRQPMCERCLAAGRLTLAELVHHRVPISESTRHLMYDVSNLQSLCRPCHEREHHRAPAYSNVVGVDGLPLDPLHPCYHRGVVPGRTKARR